ncbi:MAG: hypothetical protein J0H96_14195 [Microbacterium ginsengisoli]|nr:hypothetical protein [Microbacterium ginsengisoli]
MNAIRIGGTARSGIHRILLTFAAAFLVIIGLLAMHTLSVGHVAVTGDGMTAAASEAGMDAMHAPMPAAAEPGPAVSQHVGDAGDASGMPDHAMLMIACVLALLAAVIVLLAPALLARLGSALGLIRQHSRNVLAALPHPRPPSLIALSISRT